MKPTNRTALITTKVRFTLLHGDKKEPRWISPHLLYREIAKGYEYFWSQPHRRHAHREKVAA